MKFRILSIFFSFILFVSILSTPSLATQVNIIANTSVGCGDGSCDSQYGEDCSYCPQDCGVCPTPAPSPGAGPAVGRAAVTYEVGSLTSKGITKELYVRDRVKFTLLGTNHTVILKKLTKSNVTLEVNSTPVNITLNVNETKKLDLDDNNIYDLAITLNKIIGGNRANITIKAISEAIKIPPPPEEKKCPVCPPPTAWSKCIEGKQTRTAYKCGAETNYTCQSYIEERVCVVPISLPISLPIFPIVVVVAIITIIFLVWKFKLAKRKESDEWSELLEKYERNL